MAEGKQLSFDFAEDMGNATKLFATPLKVLIVLIGLGIAIAIIWGSVEIANSSWIPKIGETATSTPINPPKTIESIMNILLGITTVWTWEALLIRLAVFLILLFAFGDIVSMFSTFSETTSWVIAAGLAVIAGVTKIVNVIAGWMTLTAGAGAVGVIIILTGTFVAAMTLNLGIGGMVRRWRMRRQVEIEGMKSEKGASRVKNALANLGDVEEGFRKVGSRR